MPHVLIVGAHPSILEQLRLSSATAEEVSDIGAAVQRLSDGDPVDLVVGDVDALQLALDPLGLGGGPAIAAPETARELHLELALAQARAAGRDADRALAAQARRAAIAEQAAEAELVRRLAAAAAYSDDNTEEHNDRVGATAARLAAALGADPQLVGGIRVAATLHDLGKIAVPDAILLKPGRLSPEEFTVVRTHATIGARILAGSASPLVKLAATIARSHHERWDGTGYPDGLKGEEIPIAGRIVAVADVFDVLTHERPYREEWTADQARDELRRAAGSQFDPAVVEAFDAVS